MNRHHFARHFLAVFDSSSQSLLVISDFWNHVLIMAV